LTLFEKGRVHSMLRYVTSGESHGKCLIGILEGLPSGIPVEAAFINLQLRRRQLGYGRGGRMQIEKDDVEVLSGVRHGRTLGSPITLMIRNRDWSHWEIPMSPEPVPEGTNLRPLTRPRPGHVDLAGALKHQTYDARDLLERASARETAARVAVGALCQMFLQRFGIAVAAHVLAIGDVWVSQRFQSLSAAEIQSLGAESDLRCADPEVQAAMKQAIDKARSAGDTVGGVLEVVGASVPPGLGSHTQWDRKLDGILAQALMSIPAVKAVEIGAGIAAATAFGSQVHDEIFYDQDSRTFFRKTNRAGGLEAGITNGSELRARVYLKPIPTLRKPLMSADLRTKEAFEAAFERSDTCVVPAAGVIAEAMTAFVLAAALLEKFGGDSIGETEANFGNYCRMLKEY
jgi:chorismate synthase